MSNRTLLLNCLLLLSFQRGWQTLAEDCMEFKVYASKIGSCCQLELLLTPGTFDSCMKSSDEKYPDAKLSSIVCGFDCAFREMGILTGVDEIDVEKIIARHAEYDVAYQEAIGKAITTCMAQKDGIRKEAESLDTPCSMFAVKFHACLTLEILKNCPADRWDSSVLCEKVREGIPVCQP